MQMGFLYKKLTRAGYANLILNLYDLLIYVNKLKPDQASLTPAFLQFSN